MNILYVTSEAVPFCKTGGLADVAGSLPPALTKNGDKVSVILPMYQVVSEKFKEKMTFVSYHFVRLAWRSVYCGIFSMEYQGVTWYFVDNEYYFKRPGLYGYYDDGERFSYFCRSVIEFLPQLPEKPDIIHCNDWQTALVPIYLRDEGVRSDYYRSIRSVMTIHNIEYQGRYGREVLEDLFGLAPGWYDGGTIACDGDVNLLKGSIITSDAVTTVSPSYAQELKYTYYAHGLEGVIRLCETKMRGVLNGLDMDRYNPKTDSLISANYDSKKLSGKAKNKAALQESMGLNKEPKTPIIAMVSRLVTHKGFDLVCETLGEVMQKNVQVVVLGQGDKKYEDFFSWAKMQYPGRMGVQIGYSEQLAMNMYAGADLFLMPSKTEPCGLSQMIAMRYGTVPIVRETGGLKDTVHAYEAWNGAGNGFSFADYNAWDMCHVICEAIDLYHNNPDAFRTLQERGMTQDFSWAHSAKEYQGIYQSLC